MSAVLHPHVPVAVAAHRTFAVVLAVALLLAAVAATLTLLLTGGGNPVVPVERSSIGDGGTTAVDACYRAAPGAPC